MSSRFDMVRFAVTTAWGSGFWVASQQSASAQVLLAQTGGAKTAIGWVIVLLCIALGLLVVCRPSGRRESEGKRK